jgi:hypothetical protein
LGNRDPGFDVGREKQGFDSAAFGFVEITEFPDVAANLYEFFRKRRVRPGGDDSKIQYFRNGMTLFEYRETYGSGSRIDAQDN